VRHTSPSHLCSLLTETPHVRPVPATQPLIRWLIRAHKFLIFLISNFSLYSEYCSLSFGRFPRVWILCADISEHSVCSFFIGGVNRKNNRDEIVGAYIQEKVWLQSSLSQSDGGMTGRGRVQVENRLWRARTSSGPERRQPSETQQFYFNQPMAPLPRTNTEPFLPHIHTTALHLGSLPSTACFSTRTHPLPVTPQSDWLRLFLIQTFSHMNTSMMSSRLFFLLTPPMMRGHVWVGKQAVEGKDLKWTRKKTATWNTTVLFLPAYDSPSSLRHITFSPSHTYYWPPLGGVFALHSLFLYSDAPPACHPSIRLARAIFEPNLFPYKYVNDVIPVIIRAYAAYYDGAECSEMSAYKIQSPWNHAKERIQVSNMSLS